jgi:ComF family protein
MVTDLLALFFPNHCYGCGCILHKDNKYFCIPCDGKLPRFNNLEPKANVFHDRLFNKLQIDEAFGLFWFQKNNSIQELIHDLKYGNQHKIGVHFGQVMGEKLLNISNELPELIVPVPISASKYKKRGYNQALKIAQGLSNVTGIEVIDEQLSSKVNTVSQTRLSRLQRYNNAKESFVINSALNQKNILLVDDIFTTGATLEALGNACIRANCGKISVATIGIAI